MSGWGAAGLAVVFVVAYGLGLSRGSARGAKRIGELEVIRSMLETRVATLAARLEQRNRPDAPHRVVADALRSVAEASGSGTDAA